MLRWQTFLRKMEYLQLVTDVFDLTCMQATQKFQTMAHVTADGIVGQDTVHAAASFGFQLVGETSADPTDKSGPMWPPAPASARPMTQGQRQTMFGKFAFQAAPSSGNPEGIRITDGWADDNLVMVPTPTLGMRGITRVRWNKRAQKQLVAFLAAIDGVGLTPRILTWDGSYNARFMRGSATVLSAHAWGTAFDINAGANGLGARPALLGQRGCVREIAALAMDHGFYWGGWFGSRPDGMHFEVSRVIA